MPIRAEERARYPDDWDIISAQTKHRAGWRCECEGECGRGTHDGRCPNLHHLPAYGTGSRVILTTAHLNHTPEDCRPENLKAMCQGCHLHYDKEHHAETRRRRAELVEEARRENRERDARELRELFYAARNANAARTEGEKNHGSE